MTIDIKTILLNDIINDKHILKFFKEDRHKYLIYIRYRIQECLDILCRSDVIYSSVYNIDGDIIKINYSCDKSNSIIFELEIDLIIEVITYLRNKKLESL